MTGREFRVRDACLGGARSGAGRTFLTDHQLTCREREALALLGAGGLSNTEISTALVLSTNTVKDHIKATYAKPGVHHRVQAAVIAIMAVLASAAQAPVAGVPVSTSHAPELGMRH